MTALFPRLRAAHASSGGTSHFRTQGAVRPRTAFQAWIVLAVVHVMFWAVVADRTMERIWIAQ
jgi:hypothetical protein